MPRRLLAAVLGSVMLAAAGAASAQVTEEEIVVPGVQVDEALRSFVGQIAAAPQSEDQLGRWDRRICPSVAGIQSRYGQFIIDRMAQRAFGVDLDVGQPGCRTNVLVLVTQDSDRLARVLADEHRREMGYYGAEDAITQGRDALEAFASTPRTVRWWHVSQTVSRDGQAFGDSAYGANVVRQPDAGRLRRATRQDFARVIIIVDASRAAGVQFDALADYVAMVALAQLDPDADTSEFPTVLNLFRDFEAGTEPPAGMTDWDMAYLDGLYGATRAARNTQQQQNDIRRRMEESVTSSPDAE